MLDQGPPPEAEDLELTDAPQTPLPLKRTHEGESSQYRRMRMKTPFGARIRHFALEPQTSTSPGNLDAESMDGTPQEDGEEALWSEQV